MRDWLHEYEHTDWLHEYEHTDTLVLVLTSVMVVMDEELVT